MSYVDENLLPNERVVYRAHLHRLRYVAPLTVAALALIAGLVLVFRESGLPWAIACGIVFLASACVALAYFVQSWGSEFAVTNRRVLIKIGFIRRHTVELLLQKVEGIGVDQTLVGRMFDYGSIIVTGTGGTQERFNSIADPLEFRRQVQSQTAGDSAPAAASAASFAPDGPFCVACGTQNPAHAAFCLACGKKLVTGA
ncbi:MAG TPA: PH domain-containing protein [Thermoanaerobaculia bacterium]|nr:PH domain-containing protein [Thermoanaerobaculia bacterium]